MFYLKLKEDDIFKTLCTKSQKETTLIISEHPTHNNRQQCPLKLYAALLQCSNGVQYSNLVHYVMEGTQSKYPRPKTSLFSLSVCPFVLKEHIKRSLFMWQ